MTKIPVFKRSLKVVGLEFYSGAGLCSGLETTVLGEPGGRTTQVRVPLQAETAREWLRRDWSWTWRSGRDLEGRRGKEAFYANFSHENIVKAGGHSLF